MLSESENQHFLQSFTASALFSNLHEVRRFLAFLRTLFQTKPHQSQVKLLNTAKSLKSLPPQREQTPDSNEKCKSTLRKHNYSELKLKHLEESQLNLIPEQLESVSIDLKQKLLYWLIDIGLLKSQNLEILVRKMPLICKSGVIFADVINLLEGKSEPVKGIQRKPTSEVQIRQNYTKVFQFLK